jgi:hypothetical protein
VIAINLDLATFGSGYGYSAPFSDQRFFWLVDTKDAERAPRNGRFYTFNAWLGAQLHSTQWTHPRAGERRRLSGRDYVVYQSHRRWLRVMVAWRLVELDRCRTLDDKNSLLAVVEKELCRV